MYVYLLTQGCKYICVYKNMYGCNYCLAQMQFQ